MRRCSMGIPNLRLKDWNFKDEKLSERKWSKFLLNERRIGFIRNKILCCIMRMRPFKDSMRKIWSNFKRKGNYFWSNRRGRWERYVACWWILRKNRFIEKRKWWTREAKLRILDWVRSCSKTCQRWRRNA